MMDGGKEGDLWFPLQLRRQHQQSPSLVYRVRCLRANACCHRNFFLFHPTHPLRRSFSCSLLYSGISDPGSHGRFFSPLPITARALRFYRENISFNPFFPRRLTSNWTSPDPQLRRAQDVSLVLHLKVTIALRSMRCIRCGRKLKVY